jgi:hypothetical protein
MQVPLMPAADEQIAVALPRQAAGELWSEGELQRDWLGAVPPACIIYEKFLR